MSDYWVDPNVTDGRVNGVRVRGNRTSRGGMIVTDVLDEVVEYHPGGGVVMNTPRSLVLVTIGGEWLLDDR